VEFWNVDDIDISLEQTYAWMDKWCAEHALKMVITGAAALMNERTNTRFLPPLAEQSTAVFPARLRLQDHQCRVPVPALSLCQGRW